MSSLHISFSAEPVFHIGSLAVTNSILTSLIVSVLLILFALFARKQLNTKGKPSKFQSFVELVIESLNGLIVDVTGKGKKQAMFAPIIMTFFIFILCNNWFGLLPGVGSIGFIEKPEAVEAVSETHVKESVVPVSEEKTEQVKKETTEATNTRAQEVKTEEVKETTVEAKGEEAAAPTHSTEGKFVPYLRAGTADLNTTIALALISMVMVQVVGFKFLGFHYIKKFFDFSNPIGFFVGILELVSDISKIISFAFRLFGNIFAGEVLLAVISSLVPIVVPMPFYGLEIFVGLVQALVFAMLSLVFFNIATIGHGGEDH